MSIMDVLSFAQRCREPHKLLKGGDISRTRTAIYTIILGYRKHGQKGLSMSINNKFVTAQAEQTQTTTPAQVQTNTAEQTQDKTQENKTSTTIRLTIEAPEWDFILGIVKKLLDAYPELEYSLGKISGNEAFFEIDVFDDDDLKAYTTELNQWFKETGIKGTVDTRIITFYE